MSEPSAAERLDNIRQVVSSGYGLDNAAAKRLERALEAAERERDDQHKAWNKASWERDEAQAEAARLREGLRNPLLMCSECASHRIHPGTALPGHRCPEEARAALEPAPGPAGERI